MKNLVLASASPRRKALLAALGIDFEVMPSQAHEIFVGKPSDIVVINARAKRDDIADKLDEASLVIGADTLVFLEEHVLGKPADKAEARRMLELLSGRTHQVLTGLAIKDTETGKTNDGFESTDVTFRKLTETEIVAFVEAVNPVDRAGAYTVDGPGSLLVEGYGGCYQNVLGFPIVRLDRLLREIGFNLFEMMNGHRSIFL